MNDITYIAIGFETLRGKHSYISKADISFIKRVYNIENQKLATSVFSGKFPIHMLYE